MVEPIETIEESTKRTLQHQADRIKELLTRDNTRRDAVDLLQLATWTDVSEYEAREAMKDCLRAAILPRLADIPPEADINARIKRLADGDSNDAEIEGLTAIIRELQEALRQTGASAWGRT